MFTGVIGSRRNFWFCIVLSLCLLVGFSRSSLTCGMWLINKYTSDSSKVTKGRVSHGAHIIKYWTISSMANKCNKNNNDNNRPQTALFYIPAENVGKLGILSLLVVFTMIIFTIIVQKMAKILVLLEAGRSVPYYRKLTRFSQIHV